MKRLSNYQREQIQRLVEKHTSLNTIKSSLSMKKSTVYYWFRKFGGKKIAKVRIDTSNVGEIGEFIGAFAGDGNYFLDNKYRYQIRLSINSKDVAYVKHLSSLITRIANKTPWVYTRSDEGVTVLRIISKEVCRFIKQHLIWDHSKTATVRLASNHQYDTGFVRGFLKGLIDTDGYIDGKTAKFATISPGLAKNIEDALRALSISSSTYLTVDKTGVRKPIYRIVVSKDFRRFVDEVKPQHFKCLPSNTIRALVV